ncbi:unnamed protein product [Calicophoron daubneyi]|uniref:Novel acetylcholine receptor chaperone n=1 Tax=Calicophoron daubneyi TaxID=300641 RepID=A0AAV2T8K8_CALDB
MSNTALTAISVAVGLFFVFFGTLKLAPIFSEDLYRNMRKTFVTIYSSFPLSGWTGWSPSPHIVRRIYGATEVVGGLVLAICSGVLQDISSGILLLLMLFNLYGVWNVSEGLKEASNSIVFGLLLTCRFVIRAQAVQSAGELSAEECDQALKDDIRRRVAKLRRELTEMNDVRKSAAMESPNGKPKNERLVSGADDKKCK